MARNASSAHRGIENEEALIKLDSTAEACHDPALLHGATGYLSMLHDSERNQAYEAGLQHLATTISKEGSASTKLVLDLGAGNGLLSMLACRLLPGSDAIGCEVYDSMATLARQLAEANGLKERVTIVNKLAGDLEIGADLPHPADVCIFELFDSQLLGESVLPILRDAHERLLKPGAYMIPVAAQLHAMLVECCPVLASADLPELRGAPWPLPMGVIDDSVIRPLSVPWQAAYISFSSVPAPDSHMHVAKVSVTASGTVHGVLWWWELDMGGDVHLSSRRRAGQSIGSPPVLQHWRPCLSFISPRSVDHGAMVCVSQVHDDDAVWFAWHEQNMDVPPRWKDGVRLPQECEHLLISMCLPLWRSLRESSAPGHRERHMIDLLLPLWRAMGGTTFCAERERHLMVSHQSWNVPMRTAATATAHGDETSGGVLLSPAEDGVSLPFLEQALRAIYSNYSICLPTTTAEDLFQKGLLDKRSVVVTHEEIMTKSTQFAAVVVEPYMKGATYPWTIATTCLERLAVLGPCITPHTLVFPKTVSIMVMAIECQSIWLARQPLPSICHLDMGLANSSLVPSRCAPVHCNLCELPWRPLSDHVEALRVEIGSRGPWRGQASLAAGAVGLCHGVVIWAQFDSLATSLRTGPPPYGSAPTGHAQAVALAKTPVPFVVSGADEELAYVVEAQLSPTSEFQLSILRSASAKRRKV